MTARDWALAVHLLGVVFLFSGMSIAGVGHAAARRQERPSLIAVLLGLTRVGVLFVVVGSLFVLVGGFWLIGESDGFYSLSDGWIAAGLDPAHRLVRARRHRRPAAEAGAPAGGRPRADG